MRSRYVSTITICFLLLLVTTRYVSTQNEPEFVITTLSWNAAGDQILVGTNGRFENASCIDGALLIKRLGSNDDVVLEDSERCGYVGADFSFDNEFIVAQNGRGVLATWDVASLQSIGASNINIQTYKMELAPTDSRVARLFFGDSILISNYEIIRGDEADLFLDETISNIADISWSHDSTLIAAASDDGTIGIWETDSGKPLGAIEYELNKAKSAVAWSVDSAYIAFGDASGRATIWNRDAEMIAHQFYEHKDRINDLKWNPDGTQLASASEDGTVKIWDAATGDLLETLTYTGPVYALDWSPDGEHIAFGGADISGNPPQVEIVPIPTPEPTPTLTPASLHP